MLNFVYFVLFFLGGILLINSVSKLGIIVNSMDDRFYGYVVDKDLQKKIKIVDYLRCLKHFFAMLVGFFVIITVAVFAFGVTLNITPISLGIIVFYIIKELIDFWFSRKYKLDDLYNSIREQWKNEKKVSERHGEEVAFVRGYDDIENVFFQNVCWVVSVFMWLLITF